MGDSNIKPTRKQRRYSETHPSLMSAAMIIGGGGGRGLDYFDSRIMPPHEMGRGPKMTVEKKPSNGKKKIGKFKKR